ncbi:hypothetical protein [Streptomyces sp. NPDC001100]
MSKNLVMVARLIDEDPEGAYAYSKIALRLASRVAAVREAAGFAAYANQKYSEALAEFRAARRMTGSVDLWPVMADCERGLGRPEKALEMAGAPEVHKLDKAGQVEMRLVAAGARRDMDQLDAAIVTLQSPELASNTVQPWTARLRYAYADALLAAGREDEAREWFAKAVESDKDGSTDASDRLAEMDGVEFVDAFVEDEEDEDDTDVDTGADSEVDDEIDGEVDDEAAPQAEASVADEVDVDDEDDDVEDGIEDDEDDEDDEDEAVAEPAVAVEAKDDNKADDDKADDKD